MRLGIISGTTAYRAPNGEVWVNHSIGRLCEAIRLRFPQTRILLPILTQRIDSLNHVLQYPAEDVSGLPPLVSTIQSQRFARKTRVAIRTFADDVDALFIRLPFQIPRAVLGLHPPKLLHVVSNPLEVVRASTDYRGPMKWLAQAFAWHSNRTMRKLAAEPHTRLCTNGDEMWRLLNGRHGRVVVSSCLSASEVRPKSELDLQSPPRILFVGYLRPEKGVGVLLDAFAELRAQRELRLTVVGGSDRATHAENEIRRQVAEHPYRNDISLVGMVPFGERLFEMYRTHDVLVVPSFSEGTPRTLVEARAFGCPVVATNVGGIPDSVNHGVDGLLIPPRSSGDLAAAVNRLLSDESLRLNLIQAGITRSREFTVEFFADVLAQELVKLRQSTC